MQRLLIVDDDREIRSLLARQLSKAGFYVSTARGAAETRDLIAQAPIDLVIMDLCMPGEDGLSLCRYVREKSNTPVIMISARTDPLDRVVGLEMGADDYVTKPFDSAELIARIRSVLRRTAVARARARSAHAKARFDGWTLDLRERHLTDPSNRIVTLSGIEFEILRVMVSHPMKIMSRDQLVQLSTGRSREPLQRAIDVHISHLRRKLGDGPASPSIIRTVRNQGYVLTSKVTLE
jgi:two-component system, OmpR family, response regulator